MKITYLCGRICSGKSTYRPEARRLMVSDIVRNVVNSNDRERLQNSMHLENDILHGLSMCIDYDIEMDVQELIIDGIRQPSILKRLSAVYGGEIVWLEVPLEERKRRYEARGAEKDTEPFEVADNKAIELECQKIYSIFKEQIKVINN
jgi:predicted kinase